MTDTVILSSAQVWHRPSNQSLDIILNTAVAPTPAGIGLGNVDNTSDANKPISTATATALAAKAPVASPTFTGTVSGITATMVGLGNVTNTSDTNKPVSTAQATAIAVVATSVTTLNSSLAAVAKSGAASDVSTAITGGPVFTTATTVQNALVELEYYSTLNFTTASIPTTVRASIINVYGVGLLHWNSASLAYEKINPCPYNYIVDPMSELLNAYATYAFTAQVGSYYNLALMYRLGSGPSGAGTWYSGKPSANSVNSSIPMLGYPVGADIRNGQRLKFTTASGGIVGSTGAYISQKIERLARFSGKTFVFSFYMAACSGTAPTITNILLKANYGTGGSPTASVNYTTTVSYTPTLNNLTRFSVKVSVPILNGTYGTNNDDNLEVGIWLPNALFDIYTTMWQFEDVIWEEWATQCPALPTIYLDQGPEFEEHRWLRHWERCVAGAGAAYPSPPGAVAFGTIPFKVSKRVIPACTVALIAAVNYASVVVSYADQGGGVLDLTMSTAAGNYYAEAVVYADARIL